MKYEDQYWVIIGLICTSLSPAWRKYRLKEMQLKKIKRKESTVTCNTGSHETGNAASDQSSETTSGNVSMSIWSKVCWEKKEPVDHNRFCTIS